MSVEEKRANENDFLRNKHRINFKKPKKKLHQIGIIIFLFTILCLLLIAIYNGKKIKKQYINDKYPIEFEALVEEYAQMRNLKKELVYAVIFAESSFNKDAVSNVNAIGLMQITEDTFEWVKFKMNDSAEDSRVFEDLFKPEIAIKYGTYLLRLHLDEFSTEENALAAYHSGRGQLIKWLSNKEYSLDGKNLDTIPTPKTNHYVKKVLEVKEIYWDNYFS